MSGTKGNSMTGTSDAVERRLAELEYNVHAAAPGTIDVGSETFRSLELYFDLWMSPSERRRWFSEHGEALRRAVFD